MNELRDRRISKQHSLPGRKGASSWIRVVPLEPSEAIARRTDPWPQVSKVCPSIERLVQSSFQGVPHTGGFTSHKSPIDR